MAKLNYLMNTSLDGYVEDEQGSLGWAGENKEVNTYISELSSPVGTFLYGRKMYDAMAYWEKEYADHNHSHYMLDWARLWQSADKIVYSSTLAEPRTARTRIERTFDPDAVRRLKAESRRELTVNGPELAAHAIKAGLVDEIQMLVWSVVIGGGKPFFPPGVRLDLERLETRPFRNGVIAVRYAVRAVDGVLIPAHPV